MEKGGTRLCTNDNNCLTCNYKGKCVGGGYEDCLDDKSCEIKFKSNGEKEETQDSQTTSTAFNFLQSSLASLMGAAFVIKDLLKAFLKSKK